ncbi:nuclear transport factor 2 family protein [Sphingomonas sp. NSE70-1]|uniref:Nuclear transport factor 2 family protein n=1 Tax=Sphingomonas caseinilyticus TaxID=2908205 RepID=A0ABT0RSA8_9SPHN|nr:nuclear transport factor 2 family protein [Sphingomonas caseinilyticus]MCL6697575.1 nuclear transport factor 2 family protein [Sphingomonas caseinilyticus]
MPPELQPPVSTYFEASNAHDAEAVASLFTPDGWVHDERQDHRGTEAIRGWAEETFRQYAMVQTPGQARAEGSNTVVTAEVSGTFPGSPIELDFRFMVEGERIRELKIG